MDLRTAIIDALRQKKDREALNAGGMSAGEAMRQQGQAALDAQRRADQPAREAPRNPQASPVTPDQVLPPGILRKAAEEIRRKNAETAAQG